MKALLILALTILAGCTSTPYLGARLVGSYDVELFSRAMATRNPGLLGSEQSPFSVETSDAGYVPHKSSLPTPQRWAEVSPLLKAGDKIQAFQNDLYASKLDGPVTTRRLVYCVLRDGKIIRHLNMLVGEE